MKLSEVAEAQLSEIMYAFGCSKPKAISYALECLAAFEYVNDEDVYSFLDTADPTALKKWQTKNIGKRVKLESN